MKLLLDECMPRVLCADFPEHYCRTVSQMRWRGLANGALLMRASEEFDVFITVDRNLQHQQNLKKFRIAVIVLHTYSNDYEDLRAFVPQLRRAITDVAAGELLVLRPG